jgi:hypothetical protein
VSSLSLRVPNAPSLVGLSLYAQALLMQEMLTHDWRGHLTNWTADQIVR